MPKEFKPGCQRPAIKKPDVPVDSAAPATNVKEEKKMIKVGKPAPDFTAAGFLKGKFANFKLS